MGRYQAGAGWLADADLIKGGSAAVKAAMKADGYDSEYKWGQSGGMTKFLKNSENWVPGMSYDKYLSSADVQDKAFKTNSDKSYASLVKKGVITPNMSQDDIAGILKARHIAGEGGAAQAAAGKEGPADANGTTALKYKTDLLAGNDFVKAFSPPKEPVTTSVAASAAAPQGTPVSPPSPVQVAAPLPSVFPMPKVSAVVQVPAPSPTPATAVPVASNTNKTTVNLTAGNRKEGRDLDDRNIAHIARGGMAAYYGRG